MTSKLVGKWEMVHSEGFDDFLKAMGVGYVKRKLANSIKPTMVITNHGQNWTVRVTLIGLKNIDIEFTENVPYFEANPVDERKFKSLVKPDGPDRLNQELRDPDTNAIVSTSVREMVGDKLVQTMIAGNVKAVRTFKRTA